MSQDFRHEVNIAVQRPSGERLGLGVRHGSSTISALKEELEALWAIPCACQSLLIHNTLLNGTDMLGTCLSAGDGTSTLTLVVSLKDVMNELGSPVVQIQLAALQTIGLVAIKGDRDVILAVSRCLEHRLPVVRQTAVEALSKIAEKGDHHAITEVCSRLEHGNVNVRRSAVEAISRIAGEGTQQVISALGIRLEDGDWGVRRAAVKAISEIASSRQSVHAVTVVTSRLTHHRQDVRVSAIEALSEIVAKGNRHGIAELSCRLEDQDWGVRRAAVKALAKITERGDEYAITAVNNLLDHPDEGIRQAAAEALRNIVTNHVPITTLVGTT